MSDREFENYLTLIGRLLRLNSKQREAIGEELRDHFESRLAELMGSGFTHERAVQIALEEFGDAAGLATQFSKISQTRKRRILMRCTIASVLGLAAAVFLALAVWPDNHAPKMIDRAEAQSLEKPQTSAAQRSENQQQRHLFRLQNVFCSNIAGTLTKAYPPGDGTGALVVAEPTSNSLLVSAPPETLKEISNLIAEIDSPYPSIAVDVWFVKLQPETEFLQAGRRTAVLNQLLQLEREGKAAVTNHFQLTCSDNQPAFAEQGERRPGIANPTTVNSNRTSTTTHESIGTTIQVQARVSSGNVIIMSLDAEKSTAVAQVKDGAVGPGLKAAERSELPAPTNIAILGQSTIRIARGDIVNLTGVESMPDESAGSYQILISADVLPQGETAK
ncbi:MAG TPA: permease prefix domain 1-containing protein [Pirellulales bacterium]|jgi:hypothetical protein|nr:permease prefix domain 1-containing protein [Pirellulales bacterium]